MKKTCSFDNPTIEDMIDNPPDSEFNKFSCLYPVRINSVNLLTDTAMVRFVEDYPAAFEDIKDSVEATVIFNNGYEVLNKATNPIIDNVLIETEPTVLQLDYSSVFLAYPIKVGTELWESEKKLVILCRSTSQPDIDPPPSDPPQETDIPPSIPPQDEPGIVRSFSGILNDCLYLSICRVADGYNPVMHKYTFYKNNVNVYFHTKIFQDEEAKYNCICNLEVPVVDQILNIEVESDLNTGTGLYGGYVFIHDSVSPFYFIARLHMFPDPYEISTFENISASRGQYIDKESGLCIKCFTEVDTAETHFKTTFEVHHPTRVGKGKLSSSPYRSYSSSFSLPCYLGPGMELATGFLFPNQGVSSPTLAKVQAENEGTNKYEYQFVYYNGTERTIKKYTFTLSSYLDITCVEEDVAFESPYDPLMSSLDYNVGWEPPSSATATLPERKHLLARTLGKDFVFTVSGDKSLTANPKYITCGEPPREYLSEYEAISTSVVRSAWTFGEDTIAEGVLNYHTYAFSEHGCPGTTPDATLQISGHTEISASNKYVYFLYTDLSIGAFFFIETEQKYEYSRDGFFCHPKFIGLASPFKYVDVTWTTKLYLFYDGQKILLDEYARTEPVPISGTMPNGIGVGFSSMIYDLPKFNVGVTFDTTTGVESWDGKEWETSYYFTSLGVYPHYTTGMNASGYLAPWPTCSVHQETPIYDGIRYSAGRKFFYKRSLDGKVFHIHTPKINPSVDDGFLDVFIIDGNVVQASEVYANCAIPEGTVLL